MKNILFLLSFLFSMVISAQEFNQFDANGKRHGIWKKNYDNTDILRYDGEFFHGKEIGVFNYYKNSNGKATIAAKKQFNKHNDIAQVTFYSSTGKLISEGQMNGKSFIGTWIYYQNKSNSILSKDTYNDNGELHGERLVYYANEVLAQKEVYENGKLHGPSIWYAENGVVIKEYAYNHGDLHGPAKYYTKNGVLVLEGQYKNDKKHGIWKYYENGTLVKEKNFTKKSKNPYKR